MYNVVTSGAVGSQLTLHILECMSLNTSVSMDVDSAAIMEIMAPKVMALL